MVLFALMISAQQTSAWGDYTNTYICDTVVRDVWGQRTYDQCLGRITDEDQQNFCNSLEDEQKWMCLGITGVVHPAEMPNIFGEDDLSYPGDCPIIRYPERNFICAQEMDALDKARHWISLSENAKDKCERVYRFCVASNYMAQTKNPFNHVLGEDQNCKDIVYRRVDESLRLNRSTYGFDQTCAFKYNDSEKIQTVIHSININQRHINEIIQNLTAELRGFYAKPFNVQITTTTTLPHPKLEISPSKCFADSDCIVVQNDCCGCNSGGKNKAIAGNYKDIWDRELGDKCKQIGCLSVLSQDISCFSNPVCENDLCTLKIDEETLCNNLDIKSNCESATNKTENETYGISCEKILILCGEQIVENPVSTTSTSATYATFTTTTNQPPTTTTTTIAQEKNEIATADPIEDDGGGLLPLLLLGLLVAAGIYIGFVKMNQKDVKVDEKGHKSGLQSLSGKKDDENDNRRGGSRLSDV